MGVMTNDRITHVIEVRHLHFIEQDGILEFARVAHDFAVADDYVFPHKTTATNAAGFARPRPAFQPRPLVNHRSPANKNMVPDKMSAQKINQHDGLKTKFQAT